MRIDRATFRRLVAARELLAETALPVRDVSSAVGVSPFHFIRVFEAVFGATPHQFRTERRLASAKALLAAGAPVTEVCVEVGFASLGSFSSLFARRVGVPPSAYRRVQIQAGLAIPLVPGCFGMLGALPRGALRNSREAPRP